MAGCAGRERPVGKFSLRLSTAPRAWYSHVMKMPRVACVLSIASVAAVTAAAPASADSTDDYLRPLLTQNAHLNSQQLLTEAGRICSAIGAGRSASEVEPMVSRDLPVTVPVALDIIIAATNYLRC